MNTIINQKLEQNIPLSTEEQQELIQTFNTEVERLKNDNPVEYVFLLKKISKIFENLNRELSEITA